MRPPLCASLPRPSAARSIRSCGLAAPRSTRRYPRLTSNSSCTVRASALSFSFLREHSTPSRREARQLEQQFGPVWRYAAPALAAHDASSTSPLPILQAESEMNATSTTVSSTGSNSRRLSIRERAVQVGLLSTQQLPQMPLNPNENASTVPRTEATARPASVSSSFRGPSTQEPLLEFLERNEDDAVVLLAMWTSLRRSCLYASEISEALALRVRYFIHLLIHRRAIAAAWELYDRLTYIGVQLRHSDLMLLLTNLPYEYSAADAAKAEAWVREDARASADRQRQAQREKEWERERAMSAERYHQQASTSAQQTPPQVHTPVAHVVESASSAESTTAAALVEVEVTDLFTHPPSTVAQQPEWVKRWVLYEASMGNLELYEEDRASTVAQGSSAIRQTEKDGFTGAVDDEQALAAPSLHVRRLLDLDRALGHVRVLQAAAAEKSQRVVEVRRAASSATAVSAVTEVQKGARIRVRGASRAASEQEEERYATEALHVLKRYLSELKCAQGSASSSKVARLPVSVAQVMHEVLRCSQSSRAVLAYLRLVVSHPCAIEQRDAVLFLRLAAEAKPWESDRSVESFVSEHVLPSLSSSDTAASYSAQSLWLSHLCSVKALRQEAFLSLFDHAQSLWTANGEDSNGLGDGSIGGLMKRAASTAQLGASHLLVEVKRHENTQRARAVVAASVQSGAFVSQSEEAPALDGDVRTLAVADNDWSGGDSDGGRALTPELVDALLLCCASVRDVVGLLSLPATRSDSAVVALHTLLEGSIYGPFSVWAVYSRRYLAHNKSMHARGPVAAGAPAEKSLVSAAVALFLLEVSVELCDVSACRDHSGRSFGGARLLSPVQLRLLLELATLAVAELASSSPPLSSRRAVQKLHDELKAVAARLAKGLTAFLGVDPTEERTVFGALQPESLQCLMLYGRLLAKLQLTPSRTTGKTILAMIPLTHRGAIRMCFVSSNALGRQVRVGLSSRELAAVEAHLSPVPRHRSLKKKQPHQPPRRRRYGALSSLCHLDDVRFDAVVVLRQQAYAALLRGASANGTAAPIEDALTHVLSRTRWEDSLLLAEILTGDLRAAPHTVSTRFFASALDRTVEGLNSTTVIAGMPPATVRPALWLDALGMYWAAVDHTGPGARASRTAVKRHERDVLAELLLPLLRLSQAVQRPEMGRQWRRTWAAKYTPEEKHRASWMTMNVQALMILRDQSALTQCVSLARSREPLRNDTVEKEEMQARLCSVATQHSNWLVALNTLFGLCGTMEFHQASGTPYALPIAQSLLTILGKSRTNLSNTGLRLKEIQRTQWDTRCALLLVQLLLRARRWKLALQLVQESLQAHEVRTLKQAFEMDAGSKGDRPAMPPAAGTQQVVEYALLVKAGLQACAIGGDSITAATLYDALKLVIQHYEGGAETEAADGGETPLGGHTFKGASATASDLSVLDAVLGLTPTSIATTPEHGQAPLSAEEEVWRRELHETATQARSFFIRAMTKKMLTSSSGGSVEDERPTE